uniref:Type III-B CRISPR module RAMP protein Cmr6 n=1 Tax=Ignisphaera aggregans TaxID=334771 RepID=A0A7J3MYW0_9CREN
MANEGRDRSMREVGSNCSCLNDCLASSIKSVSNNIISILNKSFVDCFLKCSECCKDINYVSEFSKIASVRLMNIYRCESAKHLLSYTKEYVNKLVEAIKQVFHVVITFRVRLVSRLAVHCASHHLPLEISLAWDPVLNVPYIPSSSLRGVVRAFFEANNVVVHGRNLAELFGSTEYSSDIVFFDVYPVECGEEYLIEADVITPHYSEIEGVIDEASSSPTPLIFPVLAPGTELLVVVALKEPLEAGLLNGFVDNIGKALESGLGAKTSVGYGRISVLSKKVEK